MNWSEGIIDLFMLCLNALVVRASIGQNLTFFHKLYGKHRYEFHRHIRREFPKQFLLFLSFSLIDLCGVYTVFSHYMHSACPAWAAAFGRENFG